MSGAKFVSYFGPLLDALRSLGGSGSPDEVVDRIACDLAIPDEKLNETLSSGESRFKNQVAWARFYLVRENLLDSSVRGVWRLTEKGRATELSIAAAREIFLRQVKLFQAQRRAQSVTRVGVEGILLEEEEVEAPSHKERLLTLLHDLPPSGFERLSQRLLRESGFTQVFVTGKSGDGGIDGHGTLQINPLVSFKVLFQCKRFTGTVSASHVRDFRGAMAGRADKGIVITTGTFSADAKREAGRDGVPPIEIIDGDRLIELLERLELGVRAVTAYEVDNAFFDEFRKP